MNATMERMIPTNSTTVQAVKAVQAARVVERIDRVKTRRQLDQAIVDRERRLEQLNDEIKSVREAIEGERIKILERRLQALERELANAEGEADGIVHSLQKSLLTDANADPRLGHRLEEVAARITREMNDLQTVSSNSPKRYAEQTERVKTLVKARIELSDIMLSINPHVALTAFVKTYQLED
jgi:chromosome segregation ATPase